MFGRRRDAADITPGEPQLTVRYAGATETYVGSARGVTATLVQKIWDAASEERDMPRYGLLINPTGLVLRQVNEKREIKFDITRISHYSAERGVHDRVFSWIHQETGTDRLFCHAVVCASREKAQQAAVLLHEALQVAYRDWKGGRLKHERVSNSKTRPPEPEYEFHFAAPSGGEEHCPRSRSASSGSSGSRSNNTAPNDPDLDQNRVKESRSQKGQTVVEELGRLSINGMAQP